MELLAPAQLCLQSTQNPSKDPYLAPLYAFDSAVTESNHDLVLLKILYQKLVRMSAWHQNYCAGTHNLPAKWAVERTHLLRAVALPDYSRQANWGRRHRW